jgi:hypothetical protein
MPAKCRVHDPPTSDTSWLSHVTSLKICSFQYRRQGGTRHCGSTPGQKSATSFVLIFERKLLLTFLPRFLIRTRRTPQHHPIPPHSTRSSQLFQSRRMSFLQKPLQCQNLFPSLSSAQLRHFVTLELIVAVVDFSN